MLLSVEIVLKMLEEGKTVEKIAQSANVDKEVVYDIIREARKIVLEYNKARAKKKIIVKKTNVNEVSSNKKVGRKSDKLQKEICEGAEFTVIPLGSSLTIYTDGASSGNPGHAGIGILIFDEENRQVGKVSHYIGKTTNNVAEYKAIIRALKIAFYFQAKKVKLRTDSELVVRQINGQYEIKNEGLLPLYDEVMRLIKKIPCVKIEHIPRVQNEKADFLAKKAAMGK
ncbi:MAG: ribonuclease HI family protein [Spirochaetes bacterium]|nr:ribonuclease HI family protein [Spirochaetota bacterium]